MKCIYRFSLFAMVVVIVILVWCLHLPAAAAGTALPESAGFLTDQFIGSEALKLDVSDIEIGIIRCQYSGASTGAVEIRPAGKKEYTLRIKASEEYEAFPLTAGSGTYTLYTYEKCGEFYIRLSKDVIQIQLENPLLPFLQANRAVQMNGNSRTSMLAGELAIGCTTADEIADAVSSYLAAAITYDLDIAKNRSGMDFPEPDQVLTSGRGVCLDYAVTAAAMLRSLEIPTKLLIGYLADGQCHAWNEVYLDSAWTRVDVTFMKSGKGYGSVEQYIRDDSNYLVSVIY